MNFEFEDGDWWNEWECELHRWLWEEWEGCEGWECEPHGQRCGTSGSASRTGKYVRRVGQVGRVGQVRQVGVV